MTFVLGRGAAHEPELPSGELGAYRALDGSAGAELHLDLDGPHAILVVGKRGYGKSYTIGVIAEELARTEGIAPVVVDPMGVFASLGDGPPDMTVPCSVVEDPVVNASTLDARSWCDLLGLSPECGAGGLVWKAALEASTLQEMIQLVDTADAADDDRRAALNHLTLAKSWGVFDAGGLDVADLGGEACTVLDVSDLGDAPMNAVCRGVGEALYRARLAETLDRLPWLLVDEAHTFFEGVARPTLHRLLTRGRAPGVSLVCATQRPSAISEVGVSQADILISHRLTAGEDVDSLAQTQPTYMSSSLREQMPTDPGEVLIVDDSTETVHAATIRERATPHGGGSPRVSELQGTASRN